MCNWVYINTYSISQLHKTGPTTTHPAHDLLRIVVATGAGGGGHFTLLIAVDFSYQVEHRVIKVHDVLVVVELSTFASGKQRFFILEH